MLHSAEVLSLTQGAAGIGLAAIDTSGDYAAAVTRRDSAVSKLLLGLRISCAATTSPSSGARRSFAGPHTCKVKGPDGETSFHFESLIIATGSSPAPLPIEGASLPGVIDSNGALALTRPPRRAVIVGGGAVGVEWADIWRAFGSEVTVVEILPRLVPTEDPEIGRELFRAFGRKGIVSHVSSQVARIRQETDGLQVDVIVEEGPRTISADVVLTAVGRRPNVSGLALDTAGIDPRRRA